MGDCHYVQLANGEFLNVYQTIDGGLWVQRASHFERVDDFQVDVDEFEDMIATFQVDDEIRKYPIVDFGMRSDYI